MSMNLAVLVPLVFTLFAAGCLSGAIAGLFGVGGGLVLVPVLVYALESLGYAPVAMHVALATSLAVIIPTSVRSALAHHRRNAVDLSVLRHFALWIVIGAGAGSLAASAVPGLALRVVFGAVALLISPLFLFGSQSWRIRPDLPKGIASGAAGGLVAALSASMGIGGGLFGVTGMVACSVPMHRAIGTASVLGFLIGGPAVLGYVVGGWQVAGRPEMSLGYVSVPGLAVISVASVACAPVGAALAHRLNTTGLRRLFGVFVAVNGLIMLVRALLAIGG